MKLAEYNAILKKLNDYSDIEHLAKNTNYNKEFLFVVYSQKVVQNATKRYYKIKHFAQKYYRLWQKGTSFLEISKKIGFPPVLTALLILKEDGISRKMYRKYLNDLDLVQDKRLRHELEEVISNDIIYSPEGNEIQAVRGRKGEEKIHKWLTKQNFAFTAEKDLAAEYEKTPDFLLKKPFNVRGVDINWIESKATFGNKSETKKNIKNQLVPYRELFGSGMVIYWFGFITPPPMVDGILIENGNFFKEWEE